MSEDSIVAAWALGEPATPLDWDAICRPQPDGQAQWLHLHRPHPDTGRWLARHSGLDSLIQEALLAEETRPRLVREGNGLLLILRGVNLNPGASPEDMVSIRMWLEPMRLISLRNRSLQAVTQLREELTQGRGPKSCGALVADIAAGLAERIGPIVEQMDDGLDELQEQLLDGPRPELRNLLSARRRQAVALRRYLAPQRDVLARLSQERFEAFDDHDRAQIREAADQMTRYVEDLDALRERAAVTQEELIAQLQDRMNRNMYLLSLVAAIFLPLSFVTGLLGINVGGMPGVDSGAAFFWVCVLLGIVGAAEIALLYARRWF